MKKEVEQKKEEGLEPAPRYAVYLIDQVTGVQIGAATDDLDKFTKTDLMKFVAAFKKGVKEQNDKWTKANKKDQELKRKRDAARISGDSKARKPRVRGSRKVQKP